MKDILTFITEALKSDVQKWLKQVYQTQQTLVKDNKVQPIQIDVKQLNKPKKSFLYEDITTDATFKSIVNDKQVGFVVTSQMLKNPNQYLKDDDKELKPECYPYWYQEGDNIYFVGICMYDKEAKYIDNFIHLIDIESSLIVSDSAPLNKAILNDFIKLINKEGNYQGISAKPTHPKMKANLIKLGFNSFKDNKEILTYKI